MEVCPRHGREENETETQQQAGGFGVSLSPTLIRHPPTLCLVQSNSILMSFLTRSPQHASPNLQTPSGCVTFTLSVSHDRSACIALFLFTDFSRGPQPANVLYAGLAQLDGDV